MRAASCAAGSAAGGVVALRARVGRNTAANASTTVRESAPFTRDEIVRHLNEKKIATRLLFGGNLIRQPYMQGRRYRVHGSLTNSDRIMNQTFWIGVYPGLSDAHLDYACETVRAYCRWR